MAKVKKINQIRKRRKELGLTQEKLARGTELSREFINKIENDKVPCVGLITAKRLSKALNSPIEELFP